MTTATVPQAVWDESWFAIASWKSYHQSIPGCVGIRLAARALESGDVRVHVTTLWEHVVQRRTWTESSWTARHLLTAMEKPAYDIVEEEYDVFS